MMGNTKLQEENLVVKMSPHIRAKNTSQWIMLQVIIALLFPTVAGTIIFGPKVLAFVLVGATAAAFSEYVYQKLFGKQVTVSDLSAAVTGMLVGLTMDALCCQAVDDSTVVCFGNRYIQATLRRHRP